MTTAVTRQLTLGNSGSTLSSGFSGYLAFDYLVSLANRGEELFRLLALPSNRTWGEDVSVLGGGENQGKEPQTAPRSSGVRA